MRDQSSYKTIFFITDGWVFKRGTTALHKLLGVRAMEFNATFNNISVISWQSVLLVEERRVSGENHQTATSH